MSSFLDVFWKISAIVFNTVGVAVFGYILLLAIAWHVREFGRNKAKKTQAANCYKPLYDKPAGKED